MSKIGPRVWPLPECTIRFFGKKCPKNALYKNIFQTKVVTNYNLELLAQNFFYRPTGLASALIAQFVFLVKTVLKLNCTKIVFRQKLLQIKSRNFYVV